MGSSRHLSLRGPLRVMVLALTLAPMNLSCADDEDSCRTNAECEDSDVARSLAKIKCPSEVYCLNGKCDGACNPSCKDVRSDLNSCGDAGLCVPLPGSGDDPSGLCSLRPIECTSADECPAFKPATAADGGKWSCDDGICSYPGYTYATR